MKINILKDKVQNEALEVVLPLQRCGVAIGMGVGKTLIGLKHMSKNYNEFAKFLVAAPRKAIIQSWKDQAKEHKMEYLLPHIKFTTYLSLNKQSLDYDIFYADECHNLKDSHREWLSKYKGKILGLTGTDPKNKKSEKGMIIQEFCPIVYTYKTDKAVKNKILNDYRIIVHLLSLDYAKTMKIEKGDKSWYSSEAATYDYYTNRITNARTGKETQIMRIMRMSAMKTFPSKDVLAKKLLDSIEDKVILFANTKEQADSFGTKSYHSTNSKSEENLEEFKKGTIMKLSCVLQLSEGVNIPKLKEAIILHAYGNEHKSSQRIARCLRLSPEDKATVHVLCYRDTVDESWVKTALEEFDPSKIIWVEGV